MAMAGLLNSSLKYYYSMEVFPIKRSNSIVHPVSDVNIKTNGLSTAYYGNFSMFSKRERLCYLWVKILKQIPVFSKQLEKWVLRTTINIIEKRDYDYVVGFQEGLSTRFVSAFSCPNKIAWIHCDYARAYGKEGKEKLIYSRFSKIVCVSEFTRGTFTKVYPCFQDRTLAIHNLFDADRVKELSLENIDDERFDTSCFTVISMGRVCDVKRFYLIPQIVSKLKKENVTVKWYILGNVNEQEELVKLQDAIKTYRTEDVVYLGPKSNPYPYLKCSDLLVSVSSSEACPMIFNEARILNVPILSADFGSAYEFIENGRNGYVTTIDDIPEKLCEIVKHQSKLDIIRMNIYEDPNVGILTQLKQLIS